MNPFDYEWFEAFLGWTIFAGIIGLLLIAALALVNIIIEMGC